MIALNIPQTRLHVYVQNQRVSQIYSPSIENILDWILRLDGTYVTQLVLANDFGWLTIDSNDSGLSLSVCNNRLKMVSSEDVSREMVMDWVQRFVDDGSLHAGSTEIQ